MSQKIEKEYVERSDFFELINWIAKQFPQFEFSVDYDKNDPINKYEFTIKNKSDNKKTKTTCYYGIHI